ncbi:serine hydrolase domain-containing protein [Crateriforma conspicua]|uniref:serine hydrolase domain-containing protein n=1 Tax=Crateriforma conspicua TaxID=2527996 RepID=UPI00118A4869|nr:serine hydrolase [Crateriforma conspicua]QDV63261.1 Penicillin-binding protein 4* [Crateriforma conspicua]
MRLPKRWAFVRSDIRRLNPGVALVASTLLIVATGICRGELPDAGPARVGIDGQALAAIRPMVLDAIDQGEMAGCVIMAGRRGNVFYQQAFGHRQVQPVKKAMTVDTVFDLASLTKPIATATSVMVLWDQNKVDLDDPIVRFRPATVDPQLRDATVRQLMTHQAGYLPDNALADYQQGPGQALANIDRLNARYSPGTRFVYSDVGFILLGDIVGRQSGMDLHTFSQRYVFQPLGMKQTGYLPPANLAAQAAATEKRNGRWMVGEVHDPRAYAMGGVAGHAGLFSTAADLAIYAQMMLNDGVYQDVRVLSADAVDQMTRPHEIVEGEKVSVRGLGWDIHSGYSSNRGPGMSDTAFGHGGFTGTVLWIDPAKDLFFIFLSNRMHPDGKGSVNRLAGKIAGVIVDAIDVPAVR